MRLLLVEDDPELAETLVRFLQKNGYVVDVASSLAEAQAGLDDGGFDLILVDRLLPDGDGVSLISHARTSGRPQRFILLTALGEAEDKVEGLELGADDYVTKPFEPRELLARIRNAMRHPIDEPREVRRFGPLSLDVETSAFTLEGEPFALRRAEALVLAALMARPGALLPRETLETRVYGYDKMVAYGTLEAQISRLRTQLASRTDRVRIQSVRGMGYRLSQD